MPLLQSNDVEGSGNEYKLTIVYILKKKDIMVLQN